MRLPNIVGYVKDALDPTAINVSFGRFMTFLTAVFVFGWNTGNMVFAWRFNHHLPPGLAPLSLLPDAATLIAQGGFMTLFYGVTKYGEVKSAGAPPAGAGPQQ